MPEKVILYQDDYGATYEVELPLTSKVNPEEIRDKLGLPSYIDLDYFPMKSALVILWAAMNAPRLHESYPKAFEKRVSKNLIPALLFGGAAVYLTRAANPPTLAAAVSIAVTPGSTRMSRSRQVGSPFSTASKTAAAMAKTPGSPPDTTATRRPLAASVRA